MTASPFNTDGALSMPAKAFVEPVDIVRAQTTLVLKLEGVRAVKLQSSSCNAVYKFLKENQAVMIHKPLNGETSKGFARHGFKPGMGAVREEAAFIIDAMVARSLHDPHRIVPTTTRAYTSVDGCLSYGSMQDFVIGADLDDMPPAVVEKSVPKEWIESVALFHIRVCQCDGHSGNVMLSEDGRLVVIDGGLSLPPIWAPHGHFDAVKGCQCLSEPPSVHARTNVQRAVSRLDATCAALATLGVEDSSILTLRTCTLLLEVGVLQCNRPIAELADVFARPFDEDGMCYLLSPLEQWICRAVGAACSVTLDHRGDEVLNLDTSTLDERAFLTAMGECFQQQWSS